MHKHNILCIGLIIGFIIGIMLFLLFFIYPFNGSNARYSIATKTIIIDADYTMEFGLDYYKHSALHELGHYYWNEVLNKSEKGHYKKLFETVEDSSLVTSYAGTNVEECFAEYFWFVLETNDFPSESELITETRILVNKYII